MKNPSKQRLREFILLLEALSRSMDSAARSNTQDPFRFAAYPTFARKHSQIVSLIIAEVDIPTVLTECVDIGKLSTPSNTLLFQHKAVFDTVYTSAALLKAHLEGMLGVIDDKVAALSDFFQTRLRAAMMNEPESERHVQDVIEQLLIGRGMMKGLDYDRETGRVKVSVKESIPDFICVPLELAIEVKLSKSTPQSKTIVDEINADIRSYMTKYKRLLFVIYDLGSIRDEAEFRLGLESKGGIQVVIVKH